MLLHPGPPLSQSTKGAVSAASRAEKNQYHMCMVLFESKSASRYPEYVVTPSVVSYMVVSAGL